MQQGLLSVWHPAGNHRGRHHSLHQIKSYNWRLMVMWNGSHSRVIVIYLLTFKLWKSGICVSKWTGGCPAERWLKEGWGATNGLFLLSCVGSGHHQQTAFSGRQRSLRSTQAGPVCLFMNYMFLKKFNNLIIYIGKKHATDAHINFK